MVVEFRYTQKHSVQTVNTNCRNILLRSFFKALTSIENSDETSTSSVKRTVMERKTEICVSEDLSSSFQLN